MQNMINRNIVGDSSKRLYFVGTIQTRPYTEICRVPVALSVYKGGNHIKYD